MGAFAIDEKMLPTKVLEANSDGDSMLVRIHNTNTGALLRATVPVAMRLDVEQSRATGTVHEYPVAEIAGGMSISGVPGTGSCVDLDFSATQGSVTGKLLPTGNRTEVLQVACTDDSDNTATEDIEATLLDAGNYTG